MTATTTQEIVFWAGVIIAYLGTIFIPTLAGSKKTAVALLLLCSAVGWATMVGAALLFGYGMAWLQMPAAYFAGGMVAVLSMVLIYNPPEKREK